MFANMPSLCYSRLRTVFTVHYRQKMYDVRTYFYDRNITFENVGYCKMCKLMGIFFLRRVTLEIIFIVLCCGTVSVGNDEHYCYKVYLGNDDGLYLTPCILTDIMFQLMYISCTIRCYLL